MCVLLVSVPYRLTHLWCPSTMHLTRLKKMTLGDLSWFGQNGVCPPPPKTMHRIQGLPLQKKKAKLGQGIQIPFEVL